MSNGTLEEVSVQPLSPHLTGIAEKIKAHNPEPPAIVQPTTPEVTPETKPEVTPEVKPEVVAAVPPVVQPEVKPNEIDLSTDEPFVPQPSADNELRESIRKEVLGEFGDKFTQLEKWQKNPIIANIMELTEFDDESIARIALPQKDRSQMTVEQLIAEEAKMIYPDITEGEIRMKVNKFTKDLEQHETDEDKSDYKRLVSREIMAKLPKQVNFAETLDSMVQDARQKRQHEDQFWQRVDGEMDTYAKSMVGQKANGVPITNDIMQKVLSRIRDTSRYIITDDKTKQVTGYKHNEAVNDMLRIVIFNEIIKAKQTEAAADATHELGNPSPVNTPQTTPVTVQDPEYLKEIQKANIKYFGQPDNLKSAIAEINRKFNKVS